MEILKAIMRLSVALCLVLLSVPLAPPSTGAAPSAPIDHVHSVLLIKHGNQVVETLRSRLETAPEVLFARVPTLPPGDYTLHWLVRTLADADVVEGAISFRITAAMPRRTDLGDVLWLASNPAGSESDLDH